MVVQDAVNIEVARSSRAGGAFGNKSIVSKFKSIFIDMDLNSNFKYTIYKTINKVNQKMYIGCHKTTNPNDDYIGSGTILKRAIRKYGRNNFEKTILFVFDTPTEMFTKEAEIVDKLFVESDQTYNILEGGWGGFDYVNSNGKNIYGQNGDKTHGGENLLNGKKFLKYKYFLIKNGLWDEWKKKISDGLRKKFKRDGFHWCGRKHKEETKKKIGAKSAIRQVGSGNSHYGTCWIYSAEQCVNKSIRKEELSTYLGMGWCKGRKMNF